MKLLMMIMAVFEGMAGLGFLLMPVVVVSMLLNTHLDTLGGLIARLAGAAIIALAISCWQARNAERTGAGLGIVAAMLFYNIAAAVLLAYGGVRLGLQSSFIWPMIVLHGALGMWCGAILWLAQGRSKAESTP
jgi:hypothetical protein